MKTIFNDVLESQKKAFDLWSDLSSKVIDTSTTNGTKAYATKNQTFVQDWFNKNTAIINDAMKSNDPAKVLETAPQAFQKMMNSQVEYFENWRNAFTEQLKTAKFEMPGFDKKAIEKSVETATTEWNKWMQQSTKWMEENVVKHIPAPIKPAFESFQKSYATIQNTWEPITKMIKNGITQSEFINAFMPADFNQQLINQMMGFKMTTNPTELLEQSNKMFENWIKQSSQVQPSFDKMIHWMDEANKNFDLKNVNPMFGMISDMTHQMRSTIEPMFNMMDNNDQTEIVKIMKDIQFSWSSYIIKNAEMQAKMYENSRHALPEIMKTYTDKYKNSKEMPNTMDFFKQYMDTLEKYMLQVLDTKEYSVLQADASKLSVEIKSKFDQITEKVLAPMPILTKTIGNEISKELSDLKRKVRTLEQELKSVQTVSTTAAKAKATTVVQELKSAQPVSTAASKTKVAKN